MITPYSWILAEDKVCRYPSKVIFSIVRHLERIRQEKQAQLNCRKVASRPGKPPLSKPFVAVREFADNSAASTASLDYEKFRAVIQSAGSEASPVRLRQQPT